MSAKVYPTIDYIRQCFRYEDGKLFWLHRPREHFRSEWAWLSFNRRYAGKKAGSARGDRWTVSIGQLHIYRYTIVFAIHKGTWILGIDHKNRNPSDDRIENLRPASKSQNDANSMLRSHNTSGFKGVSWDKRRRHWVAHLKVGPRHHYLGSYNDPAIAHAAYMDAARKHFGEFAHDGT